LAEHETDTVQVKRMLHAAQLGIDDAKNETISLATSPFSIRRPDRMLMSVFADAASWVQPD
jgi:hypothetical protein